MSKKFNTQYAVYTGRPRRNFLSEFFSRKYQNTNLGIFGHSGQIWVFWTILGSSGHFGQIWAFCPEMPRNTQNCPERPELPQMPRITPKIARNCPKCPEMPRLVFWFFPAEKFWKKKFFSGTPCRSWTTYLRFDRITINLTNAFYAGGIREDHST